MCVYMYCIVFVNLVILVSIFIICIIIISYYYSELGLVSPTPDLTQCHLNRLYLQPKYNS